ncbi:hypothetical protein CHUAL_004699 [Chamberlinius hualienensis]
MENDFGDVHPIDTSIGRVPMAKWPSNSMIYGGNASLNHSSNHSFSRTPKARTPSGKTRPGQTKATPNKRSKTPIIGDRFIPNRSATQFDLGHFKITSDLAKPLENEPQNANKIELQRALSMSLHGCDIENAKIIAYKSKAPSMPEGFQSDVRVLFNQGRCTGSAKKTNRHIPQTPERILDAPDIMNDYYLNVIDWGATNMLAVGLSSNLYLWNATSGGIDFLTELSGDKYVSSVSWIEDGSFLGVGTSSGDVELWDITQKKRVRCMTGHTARVGALTWNEYILTSGSRSGYINHHDVRVPNHFVASNASHSQEVCGLRWSPNRRYLASGGNDNLIHVWPAVSSERYAESKPIYTFNQHTSAVKALSWCPWQSNILASGGGTGDRTIKLWSCSTGECLSSTDAKSQVCAVLWSKEYKEMISGHGYANNQLVIWKYPSMAKVTELTGHSERILHLAMSPDSSTVVSASADETLRLWNCFAVDPRKALNEKKMRDKTATFGKTIR